MMYTRQDTPGDVDKFLTAPFRHAGRQRFRQSQHSTAGQFVAWLSRAHADYRGGKAGQWPGFTPPHQADGIAGKGRIGDEAEPLPGDTGLPYPQQSGARCSIDYRVCQRQQRKGLARQR